MLKGGYGDVFFAPGVSVTLSEASAVNFSVAFDFVKRTFFKP